MTELSQKILQDFQVRKSRKQKGAFIGLLREHYPELSIEQAVADYRRLGYSEAWINQRMRSIEVRKHLTDEWKRAGVEEGQQYASLTNIITQAWSGKTVGEYKQHKGLHKESLRANMTNLELTLNTLAEITTAELH